MAHRGGRGRLGVGGGQAQSGRASVRSWQGRTAPEWGGSAKQVAARTNGAGMEEELAVARSWAEAEGEVHPGGRHGSRVDWCGGADAVRTTGSRALEAARRKLGWISGASWRGQERRAVPSSVRVDGGAPFKDEQSSEGGWGEVGGGV